MSSCTVQECVWEEDAEGIFHTACNESHEFYEDGPEGNNYRFCPYCGKTLKEIPFEDQEDN